MAHYRQQIPSRIDAASPRTLQRNGSGKLSYSPGTWKNYIASDLLRRPQESRSSYNSGMGPRVSSPSAHITNNNSYYQHPHQQNQYVNNSNEILAQMQEKERKKEEMLRRVRQIQEKVIPLIDSENGHKSQDDLTWKVKIQQKVNKLETVVDSVQKNLELKLERQVVQLQRKMMQKYLEIQSKIKRKQSYD